MDRTIIYLDNNATTPIDPRVLEAMMPYLTDEYANASSTHIFGVKVNEAVKKARQQVADLIGAQPYEIVFTSGATEAINLAIKGVCENYKTEGKHIITVSTEHSAVLDTCRYIENQGFEVTYLPVKNDGLIELEDLKKALREDTILVSIMLANNETGVIQPINEISKIVHETKALLFSDTTQAVGKIPVDVNDLDVDLICMSGHKMYAPKGMGALYIRQNKRRIKLTPLLHGGGHEKGLRSGTLNVPGIVALGAASALLRKERPSNEKIIRRLRDHLEQELVKIEGAFINGNLEYRLPNTLNICFPGVDSDALILSLSNPIDDCTIVAISNGSACTSTSIEPSHVLSNMGINQELTRNSVRFSIGRNNTIAEIEQLILLIKNAINNLKF